MHCWRPACLGPAPAAPIPKKYWPGLAWFLAQFRNDMWHICLSTWLWGRKGTGSPECPGEQSPGLGVGRIAAVDGITKLEPWGAHSELCHC